MYKALDSSNATVSDYAHHGKYKEVEVSGSKFATVKLWVPSWAWTSFRRTCFRWNPAAAEPMLTMTT
jgi:hypothetical protein